MILTPADRSSATWQRILRHLLDCKQNTLIALGRDQPELQTAKLRGELACLERLILLHEQPDLQPEAERVGQRVGTF